MSRADVLFVDMCSDIIENGFSTEGQKVRPVWEDGTPAHTIKKFGVVNRYNLQEEFPALTLRPTAIKSATDEMLWIWQKKSNNINELNSHIWDEWADESGSIGKAYGYQLGVKYKFAQDILAANNWNVVQYSILLMMIAQATGFKAGELVHVIADAHIYDRHVPIIKEMIERPQYPAPTVRLNPDVKDFYDFTVDDVIVENYEKNPQIKDIPIAI